MHVEPEQKIAVSRRDFSEAFAEGILRLSEPSPLLG